MKIKILYVDNTFSFGGAIVSLRTLLKGLDKRRYEPILITAQPETYLRKKFQRLKYYQVNKKLPWVNNALFTRIISARPFRNRGLLKLVVIIRFLYWLFFITIPEALLYHKIGRKHEANIVHLNNIFSSQLAGILAAKILRVPCIAHLRDFERLCLSTKFYAKIPDHHIAISSAIRDNLLQLGVPEGKISIVHDSIDFEEFNDKVSVDYLFKEFNIRNDEKLFGIFGRIVEWKGIKEFILASNKVFEAIPSAKAFIVGNVSNGTENYYNEIRLIVDKLNLGNKIVFTGYRDDIPALMKLMDLIVHASTRPEPFGIVIIEAMAMGKPVVATECGGPLDIVASGKTGFLVPPGDGNKMSEAIVRIFENPTSANKMGMEGKKRVKAMFTKERYAKEVEQIYESLLRGRTKKSLYPPQIGIPKNYERKCS